MNCRGIDGNSMEIDLIQDSHPPLREREREREMHWFILPFISNIELQLYIYRILTQISLAHMAQDNWLVNSTCVL